LQSDHGARLRIRNCGHRQPARSFLEFDMIGDGAARNRHRGLRPDTD